MKKKSKIIWVTIIIAVLLISPTILIFTGVRETAIPDITFDERVEPQFQRFQDYPIAESTFDTEISDTLPLGAEPSRVRKFIFSADVCGKKVEFILNGKSSGTLISKSCDSLFYAERGSDSEFQHYDTITHTFNFDDGVESKDFTYKVIVEDNIRTDIDNPQYMLLSAKLTTVDMVSCNADINCEPVVINNEITNGVCDYITRKCSYDTGAVSVEDVFIEGEQVKEANVIALNPKTSILVASLVILAFVGTFVYFYMKKW